MPETRAAAARRKGGPVGLGGHPEYAPTVPFFKPKPPGPAGAGATGTGLKPIPPAQTRFLDIQWPTTEQKTQEAEATPEQTQHRDIRPRPGTVQTVGPRLGQPGHWQGRMTEQEQMAAVSLLPVAPDPPQRCTKDRFTRTVRKLGSDSQRRRALRIGPQRTRSRSKSYRLPDTKPSR